MILSTGPANVFPSANIPPVQPQAPIATTRIGFGCLMVHFKQACFIAPVDGSVHQQHIGMPDTSNKQHSESFHIKPWRQAIQDLNVTVIAGSSAKVEQPK